MNDAEKLRELALQLDMLRHEQEFLESVAAKLERLHDREWRLAVLKAKYPDFVRNNEVLDMAFETILEAL